MDYVCTVGSPVGRLTLASDGESITGIWMEGQKYYGAGLEEGALERSLPVFDEAKAWLEAYFNKERPQVTFALSPRGSAFRQAVWAILLGLPYGSTITYGEIAERLRQTGKAVSAQAVGGAVGHNPISVIIPCHRVVGANGSLTGYAGGLEKKQMLLALEGADTAKLFAPNKGTAL